MVEKTHDSPKLPDYPEFAAPTKRHPIAAFFGTIFAVLIVVGAGYAVYVWQHKKVADTDSSISATRAQVQKLQQQINTTLSEQASTNVQKAGPIAVQTGLVLDNDVSFSLPAGWVKATAAGLNSLCTNSADGDAFCEDVATIVPSSLNTDASPFSLTVREFKNTANVSAQTWFNNVYDAGLPQPANGDQSSTAAINGYSAYYYLQKSMPSYQDVYYVIAAKGHAVLLNARVYQGASGSTAARDFTQYLPAIQAFADSIRFGS